MRCRRVDQTETLSKANALLSECFDLVQLQGLRPESQDKRPPLEEVLRDADDARFVNALCQLLDFEVLEKQRLLEVDDIADRYDVLRGLIRFRLAQPGATHGPGSGVLQ